MPKQRKQDKQDDYAYRNVTAAALNEVWAIDEGKLEQIRAFLEIKARGGSVDADDIRSAIGGRARDDDDAPEIRDGVALMRLVGVLSPRMNLFQRFSGGTSTQKFAAQFRKLLADDEVKTILIEVDSPGGVVTGTEELRRLIFQSRGTKRIVAVAQGMVASAAYYIASAATELVATPSTTVGSIGVYAVLYEATKAYSEAGITLFVFRAGKLKAAGNQYEKLTDDRRASIQARIDDPYAQFLSAVSAHRGVSIQVIESTYGQGTVFLADKAADLGMIDSVVDSLDDVFTAERSRVRGSSRVPSVTTSTMEDSQMDKKILAALYARGLITAEDVDETVAKAALHAFFAGRGEDVPDDKKTLAALLNDKPAAAADPKPEPAGGSSTPAAAADTATPADDLDAEERGKLAERNRLADISARATLLDMSGADIKAAVESGDNIDAIVGRWTKAKAAKQKPVITPAGSDSASYDRFVDQAVAALLRQCGMDPGDAKPGHLAGAPLSFIAAEAVRLSGRRVVSHDREQVALEFLKLGDIDTVILGADPSYNRAGAFPHLLSALANKVLDQALPMAEPSYPEWTARLADVPDFKPITIHGIAGPSYLDELLDDHDTPDGAMLEETPAWAEVARYGAKIGLTPVMVANDDLDGFTQGIRDLAFAHENTLNALCVALVTANVTMPDGNALLDDTNHANYVASSGGAPSITQMQKMRSRHMKQPGINGGYVNTFPKMLLCPVALLDSAEQVCLTPAQLVEVKTPATDATVNVYRGRITPIPEPLLDASSTAKWYTIADPRTRRTVCHVFQRGHGRGGRRSTWFRNENKTRYYELEGRFAAVAVSWRGFCGNVGA